MSEDKFISIVYDSRAHLRHLAKHAVAYDDNPAVARLLLPYVVSGYKRSSCSSSDVKAVNVDVLIATYAKAAEKQLEEDSNR